MSLSNETLPIELKNRTVCSRHHYSLNLETLLFKETNKSKKNGTTSAVKVEKLQKPEKLSNKETVKVGKISKGDLIKPIKVEKKEANGDTTMAEKTNLGETIKVEKIYKDERQASIIKKPSQHTTSNSSTP